MTLVLLFALVVAGMASKVAAQTRYELTVKEAVELAFKDLAEVKNAALDIEIQQAQK